MLLCYDPDTVYGLLPIWRISNESALVVEINFTWSLGFEARISFMMFEFSSCLFADLAMNLVSDSSNICLRSGYEAFPLLSSPSEVSVLLAFEDVPLCHFCISGNGTFRVKDGYFCISGSFSGNGTFRVKDLSGGNIEPNIE
ncbi:hypothetical protein Tco_1070148 [Tanacetum coccineum]|uniref:Uncharacterized protein n=1 Tax=Tanacetum coccineum TaxID=301880 RepID=A0ABQ5HKL6_9ASTR